tara:strand:+ start:253 stop:459 length:207 start_codon:yes stop_codon:yes gene_type:complete
MNYNIFDLIITILFFIFVLYQLKKLYYVSVIKRKKTSFENRIQINAFVFLVLGTIVFYNLLKDKYFKY